MRITVFKHSEEDAVEVNEYIHSLVSDSFRIVLIGRYKGNFVIDTTEEYFLLLRLKYGSLSVWENIPWDD